MPDEGADTLVSSNRILVSVSRDAGSAEQAVARRLALENGWEFLAPSERGGLAEAAGGRAAIVVEKKRLTLRVGDSSHAFHPGLAPVRIKRLLAGETDYMLAAMGLNGGALRGRSGERVLDCTLGFGADAVVAAFSVGDGGRVVGLESERVLAVLTRHGLLRWADGVAEEDPVLAGALRRVEVIHADHLAFLLGQASRSFDVVYFDPMFRKPAPGATGLATVRLFGRPAPLDRRAVDEALRVARRRVVLKERRGSPEFARLGCDKVVGGASSRVAFGVWEV